jgi:hypothetical protein
MALLQRSSFARGWTPNADAVNAPVDALLRMDNCVLDELGAVTLRQGSVKLNVAPLADLDVHSLFTAVLNGTRYRLAGAGNTVYVNGAPLVTGLAGTGDMSFGSYLGQVLVARGTSRLKSDGAALRNWGIAMTGGAPTIAAVAADGKTFASFDSGEAPAFSVGEDNGTGATFATGEDGSANGAFVLQPNAATNRASITKTFAAATDFTAYDAGGVGTDNDLLQIWVYVTEPSDLLSVTLMIDVNPASTNLFQDDYYIHNFVPGDLGPLGPTDTTTLTPSLANQGTPGARARGSAAASGSAIPRADFSPAKPIANAGWSKLAVRRGDMTRTGSTSGKDWTTVHAVRLVITTTQPTPVQFDLLRIVANPLNGSYKWCYVLAFNSGTYVGKSAPSPLSAAMQLQAQGATVTVPADGARDPQANEVWLYRMGGVMDAFYRVAVKTGVVAGAVDITDSLSDLDAMVLNLKLETDNGVPPSGIISIEGPSFDRVFALTPTTLWPSRRVNPDSFARGQAITIAGNDETAFWVRKALGGLYVGTSRDIYRIDGTGAELPDGSIDFIKTPLNVDHPPVNDAVAMDGNLLIYFSGDGWRAIGGAGSVLLVGETSLLYRGYTRHGLAPVNVAAGRFRATISKGQLVAITPEGADTTGSRVLYRHAPTRTAWYRHIYAPTLRCVYHEPDGTLLASDTGGTVWQFDVGSDDAGAKIPITIWTKQDDDGQPFNRKDPVDLRVQMITGSDALTVALHPDAADTPALTAAVTNATLGITSQALDTLPAYRLIQGRLTGSFTTFRLIAWGVQHLPLPVPVHGHLPRQNFGAAGVKRVSGLQLRLCTIGLARILTPYFDGVAQPGLTVTSSADEPLDVTYQVLAPITATEIGLSVDGDVELYEWRILASDTQPLGVKVWDSGPIDLGDRELVWIRRLDLKVKAGADLTIIAYLDDVALATRVALIATPNLNTVVPVDFPRGTKGRQPRLVVTSPQPFYPYWIKVIERVTGQGTEKPVKAIPFTVGGGSAT